MKYTMQEDTETTFLIPFNFLIAIALIFFAIAFPLHGASAQDSDLEKSVYKKSTESKPSPPPSNAKPAAKKPARQTTAASKPVKKTRSSKTPINSGKSSEMIDFTFRTPGPNQEVWLGEMKLGVSNNEAKLLKSIKPGVYLVTLKETEGEVLLRAQLVNVSADRPSMDLKSKDELNAAESTADDADGSDPQNDLKTSEKVLEILARYADPKENAGVTTDDWQYVLNLAQMNQIKGFTQVQIEAQKWFASGQIELSKGNYPDALTAFQSSKNYMAGSAYPDYAIGETYFVNNQINEALRFYISALAIQPQFALAHGRMGDIYVKLNKSKEAAASYTAALQYGLDSPSLRLALAKEQMKNKRWEEAAELLETIVETAPSGDVYLTLGDLYREQKRVISAYEAYLRATELLPMSSVAFFKLGEVLYEEKEFGRARAAFAKALELDNEGTNINVVQARKYLRESEEKLK